MKSRIFYLLPELIYMHEGDFPGRARGAALASAHEVQLQDLDRHIRSPDLKRIYHRWRAALLDQPTLPAVDTFNFAEDGLSDHAFVVAVEDTCFRLLTAGQALAEHYGQELAGTTIVDDAIEIFGSLKASYSACAEKEAPVYEYVRSALGEGRPFLFERLIMPFFDAGSRVTHLAGVVLFTELGQTH
jgi:hypothetical protein